MPASNPCCSTNIVRQSFLPTVVQSISLLELMQMSSTCRRQRYARLLVRKSVLTNLTVYVLINHTSAGSSSTSSRR